MSTNTAINWSDQMKKMIATIDQSACKIQHSGYIHLATQTRICMQCAVMQRRQAMVPCPLWKATR